MTQLTDALDQTSQLRVTLEETTTPAAVAGFGKVYTKNDNHLYFQDGAGVEHEIGQVDEHFAEMYFYESAGSQTVGVTDEYYGLNGVYSAGDLSEFTLVAGKNGSGNITTAGGGLAININDAAHGLLTGDYVTIQSANHSSTAIVTRIDAANFTLPIPFGGNEACTWQMGDYLLAGAGTAGMYTLHNSFSGAAGAASKNFKFETVINQTHQDKAAFEITTSGTNHQSGSSSCFVTIAVGDRIWFIFKNETDTQDLDFEHSNINLSRL